MSDRRAAGGTRRGTPNPPLDVRSASGGCKQEDTGFTPNLKLHPLSLFFGLTPHLKLHPLSLFDLTRQQTESPEFNFSSGAGHAEAAPGRQQR